MVRLCVSLMELQKYIIGIISTVLYLREAQAFVNVRLENGNGMHEGSVEITTNGYDWEIICGNSEFDMFDVIVICRQLGYPGANRVFTTSPYPAGNYPMSSTGFYCTGTEIHLNDCLQTTIECASRRVAGALCYTRDSGYLGCFNDNFENSVLTGALVTDAAMTLSRCVSFCQTNQFAYAGLKYGIKCLCGAEDAVYDRYGKTSDADCNYQCGGSGNENCGGYEKMSIFRVNSVVTMSPMTTMTSYHHTRRTGTPGYGYNNTQPEVSHGYPSTPAVTVRMVAKEGNFINQPSGIAVVISLSVATIILILIVIFLVRRRSSQPDPKRKPSNRPYEEITLEVQEMESPGTAPNAYCETGDVPLNTPLVVTPPNHNYEHAELFSPGERTSEMYCTVPNVQDHSSAEPNGRSKPETPPAIRDLYAKPMKETARVQRNDTSYETIDDEDLRIDPKTYLGGPQDIVNGRDEQLENDTGYSKLQNGTDADSNLDLDEMYAKPLKKEHRKVVKEDSFDETVMVENELYTSTDSKA